MKEKEKLKKVEQLARLIVNYLKLVIDYKSLLEKKYLLKAKELKGQLDLLKLAQKSLAKAVGETVTEEEDPSKAEIEALINVLSDFEAKKKKLQKNIESTPAPQLAGGKDLLNQVA